jgi:choline kinase
MRACRPTRTPGISSDCSIESGATLLVDRKIASVFDLDDATKVKTDGNHIVAIGKQLTEYDCIDTGIFVCTTGLVRAIGEVAETRGDASLSDGVQQLSQSGLMTVLDVGEETWMDVDTPEMLADAEARLAQMRP